MTLELSFDQVLRLLFQLSAEEKIRLAEELKAAAAAEKGKKPYKFPGTREEILARFVLNAPDNVPLTEAEILDEVMEHRYGIAK